MLTPSARLQQESLKASYSRNTVVSKIITPEFFSKLISCGVIYYAGNVFTPKYCVELIMRGNSVSHYVDRLFWGKKLLQNLMGINFFVG